MSNPKPAILNKTDLNIYRTKGDKPADAIIEKLAQTEGVMYLRGIMPFLANYQQLSFDNQPQILRDFLENNSSLPPIFDRKNLIRATDFYIENQQNIGLVLGLYALPYCYLGADGAQVLYISERIKNDTYKRLTETGAFLRAVMNMTNWESNKIFTICLKVRLLHALIRYFTLNSNRWDMHWGLPINQEDMLGTNMAFSYIMLKGLRKLGYRIDKAYEEAYLNTWNVIGVLLGVEPQILPLEVSQAAKLDLMIAERNFRASKEGQALASSLINTIRKFAPNETIANLLQEQSRFLLGVKYAEMLGIKETNMPKSLLKIYNTTSLILSKIL